MSDDAQAFEVELINTGSELMLGYVLNTHQQWLCRRLADLGYVVTRQVAISDAGQAIRTAVAEAIPRARLIVTTGGLGPTSDDITRDQIAELLDRKLIEDPKIVAHVESFFTARKRPMPARTRIQAMVPEGAIVLHNAHGTAPGLAMQTPNGWLIMLPGPPRELRPMFDNEVVPLLARLFPDPPQFACKIIRTLGVGESLVEDRIDPKLRELTTRGLQIGYCARVGEVDIRLVARGPNGPSIVEAAAQIVRAEMSSALLAADCENLPSHIVRTLTARDETLALAESCTGGHIANLITNVPGASAIFLAGMVTYSNQAKQKFLGVSAETLAAHGAVSEPVAREMAEGACRAANSTYALAVTGIAGPSGGTSEKPTGTVHIALATPARTIHKRHLNPYDRATFKAVTANQALDLLRRELSA